MAEDQLPLLCVASAPPAIRILGGKFTDSDSVTSSRVLVSFTVYGLPQPGGSKKAFPYRGAGGALRVAVSDANPKARPWKAAVSAVAAEAVGLEWRLLDDLLDVEFRFYLPRPAGHYGSGRKAGQVRASAPAAPGVRPDVLKLTRAAEDALTGIVWRDDAQIVTERLAKRYGEPARMEVVVRVAQIESAEGPEEG